MNVVRALFRECIDYAGLFPPAKLDMASTVQNYARYREGGDAWALGRLVLPAAKLPEFVEQWPEYARVWPLSVLIGPDYRAEIDLALVTMASIDTVECRPARVEDVAEIRRTLPESIRLFVEAPPGLHLEDMLAAVRDVGGCAKVRTGGITADAIPAIPELATFLLNCARRGLCMKATAGLHHAIGGEHPLSSDADAPRAWMHGFVNFFVAAVIAGDGGDRENVEAALASGAATDFQLYECEIRWKQRAFPIATIQEMRSRFCASFGSCSFEEPMQDLRSMGWLRG